MDDNFEKFEEMLYEFYRYKRFRSRYCKMLKITKEEEQIPHCINTYTNENKRVRFLDFKPTFSNHRYRQRKIITVPLDRFVSAPPGYNIAPLMIQRYAVVRRLLFVCIHTLDDVVLCCVPINPLLTPNRGTVQFKFRDFQLIKIKLEKYAVISTLNRSARTEEPQVDDGYSSE